MGDFTTNYVPLKEYCQASLTGEKLPTPKTLDEIKSVCCAACFYATEPKCDCQCHGAYHGLGNLAKKNQKQPSEKIPQDQGDGN